MNVTLHLEADCRGSGHCAQLAAAKHEQLSTGRYSYPVSLLELGPHDRYLAEHRTARKRAARAHRLGYRFAEIDRTAHEADVYAINTSAPERQGRPMSAAYTRPVSFSPLPDYPCPRHAIRTYGVLHADTLYAYTWVYRVGELVMFSSILGHADHLARDVMYLLVTDALAEQAPLGGYAFYNMWDSGTEGLKFFKTRIGFRPERVEWELV